MTVCRNCFLNDDEAREKILREMIGNVLIHREYTSSRPARFIHLYSGADPVFDEEDVFKLTIPLDDNYSPEQGKRSEKSSQKSSQKIIGLLRNDPQITIDQMAPDNGGKWVVVEQDKSEKQ